MQPDCLYLPGFDLMADDETQFDSWRVRNFVPCTEVGDMVASGLKIFEARLYREVTLDR